MNILYVTDYRDIARHSGGFISDYQNDLVFYGLRELFGDTVVDSTQIVSLYKEYSDKIDKRHLWGGMTSFWLIENDNTDRTQIESKIKDKYYDLIVYGAIRRCKQYYDLVNKIYPSNKVVVIDGNDDREIEYAYTKHKYFKREILEKKENILPIGFSIPSCKLTESKNKSKTQEYATCIPGQPETYIFKEEKSYYQDYQNSFYGVTTKKAGWDCMRHYEILGNYCMPYFIDLEECPAETLTHIPKSLLIEGRELAKNFDEKKYYQLLDEVYLHTEKHLTTKAVATEMLNRVL